MDRLARLRSRLDKTMAILEIGPSHNPVAPKKDGWRTTVVDHASRAELIEKYADHAIDLSAIEDVDVIWHGDKLEQNIAPSKRCFDAIIASHVLEHIPDPIAFLQSASMLLNLNGMLLLALPDKRVCFDILAPLTTTGDWLGAHAIEAKTHNKRTAFNHVAYAAKSNGHIAWPEPAPVASLTLVHSLQDALVHFNVANDSGSGPYTDYHAWRFTPSSFRLLILELSALKNLELRVEDCSGRLAHEFHVVLRRGTTPIADDILEQTRLGLLLATMAELAETATSAPPIGRRSGWIRLMRKVGDRFR